MRARKQQLDFFRQSSQHISWLDLPKTQQKEVRSLLSLFFLAALDLNRNEATIAAEALQQGGRHANED